MLSFRIISNQPILILDGFIPIGGGLCAVSVHGNFICSGYSSGAVVVWEGDAENVSSYRELISSDSVNSQRQRVHVTSTTINQKLCVAGFDNGITS